ncbi:MAG: hypothetical protein U0744_15985 [Gemmataceae bacterium]
MSSSSPSPAMPTSIIRRLRWRSFIACSNRRVPRRHLEPTGLENRGTVAAVRQAETLLRHLAGNMDSMINHYTANKVRNDDAYSPAAASFASHRATPSIAIRLGSCSAC